MRERSSLNAMSSKNRREESNICCEEASFAVAVCYRILIPTNIRDTTTAIDAMISAICAISDSFIPTISQLVKYSRCRLKRTVRRIGALGVSLHVLANELKEWIKRGHDRVAGVGQSCRCDIV